MRFDAASAARPLFKERVLWTLVMGLFFFLVYGSANQISALTAPHPAIVFDWERRLPFVPELVLPYMSSDLMFCIAFLLAPTRAAIQRLGLRCGLAIVVSTALFLLMPLQCGSVRPEVQGWPAFWFDLLRADQPYNQFPSLHISLGFIAWDTIHRWAINRRTGPLLRALVTAWFLAIAASTLLVYQHHAIDLPGGVAVILLVYRLIPEHGRGGVPLRFVTPRHLDMALRYLVGTALATIAAFQGGAAAVLFGWIALSLILVATGYTLGLDGVLAKRGRRHGLLAWLLFWPYLAGSWLNWRFWRSRVTLMAEVEPGLWLGARPATTDWTHLQQVRSVIDLVPELSATTPAEIDHHHAPLLDIVIPDPAALDAIAARIEQARGGGGVYVHCALGMSRSVLAVCAWMMRGGLSQSEALARIDRIRPERVRRPYMGIALDLYADYLAGARI